MSEYPGPGEYGGGAAPAPPPPSVPTDDGGVQLARSAAHAEGDLQDETARALALAFAPLHKRAFGIAVGTACAVFLGLLTMTHVLFQPENALELDLLREYFYGYEVSWKGVLIGTAWAFGTGFIMGWFVAFSRNLIIAVSVFLTRTRAELEQTREFLDHI